VFFVVFLRGVFGMQKRFTEYISAGRKLKGQPRTPIAGALLQVSKPTGREKTLRFKKRT
jgi:hypothetical protein